MPETSAATSEPAAVEAAPAAAITQPSAPDSPWQRLRRRFVLNACDYRPEVRRLAQIEARNPRLFEASWREAMPLLLLVVEQLEERDLPGELALVPWVESRYQPLPGVGARPAGMWQLAAGTAREAGLRVGAERDERLDAQASTTAALDLMAGYGERFDDWRLADFAYSSGEFRIRRLLRTREAASLDAAELARLHPRAQQHLDRVMALACVIEQPELFGVRLPEPGADDLLAAFPLEASVDPDLVAHLADLPPAALRRWNAAYWRQPAARVDTELLLPTSRHGRLRGALDAIPQALRGAWHSERIAESIDVDELAARHSVASELLAFVNDLDRQSPIAPGTALLLPGDAEAAARTRVANGHHVVVRGDTLSGIARRHGIPLAELRRLNPRLGPVLQIGQHIRLEP